MNRSSQHRAIVVRLAPFAETHAMVTFLTPDHGLVAAVAYGLRGTRSALRGKVVPFASGMLRLYTDPRREAGKVTDFEVERYALSLTHDLAAYYHASLWLELVWRTEASGGDGEAVFALIDEALASLERDPPPEHLPRRGRTAGGADLRAAGGPTTAVPVGTPRSARPIPREIFLRRLTAQLLWRYLAILGLQPDLETSGTTGEELGAAATRWFDPRDQSVVAHREERDASVLPVPIGTVRYLDYTAPLTLREAAAVAISDGSLSALRGIVLSAAQDAVHGGLNTVAVARGFL